MTELWKIMGTNQLSIISYVEIIRENKFKISD